jgi:hypothetical protein
MTEMWVEWVKPSESGIPRLSHETTKAPQESMEFSPGGVMAIRRLSGRGRGSNRSHGVE